MPRLRTHSIRSSKLVCTELRLIPTADHTDADIEQTFDAFVAVGKKLADGTYKKWVPEKIAG